MEHRAHSGTMEAPVVNDHRPVNEQMRPIVRGGGEFVSARPDDLKHARPGPGESVVWRVGVNGSEVGGVEEGNAVFNDFAVGNTLGHKAVGEGVERGTGVEEVGDVARVHAKPQRRIHLHARGRHRRLLANALRHMIPRVVVPHGLPILDEILDVVFGVVLGLP